MAQKKDKYTKPKLRAQIKEDLKAGDEVPGAVLEERQNIQVR